MKIDFLQTYNTDSLNHPKTIVLEKNKNIFRAAVFFQILLAIVIIACILLSFFWINKQYKTVNFDDLKGNFSGILHLQHTKDLIHIHFTFQDETNEIIRYRFKIVSEGLTAISQTGTCFFKKKENQMFFSSEILGVGIVSKKYSQKTKTIVIESSQKGKWYLRKFHTIR